MSFIDDLPEGRTKQEVADRDQMIVSAVVNGHGTFEWWGVVSKDKRGNELTLYIMRDSMKFDGVRLGVTATGAQQIADVLAAMLPTPLMTDLAWEQAYQVPPHTMPEAVVAGTMGFTRVMVQYSDAVDDLVAGHDNALVADTGKYWVVTNGLLVAHSGIPPGLVACNYGFHKKGTSGALAVSNRERVIQDPGYRHDRAHTDYSQTCRLVSLYATLNGEAAFLPDVLQDPNLAHLVSHEGVLHTLRQPGVEPIACPLRGLGQDGCPLPDEPDWPAGAKAGRMIDPEGGYLGFSGSMLANIGKGLVIAGGAALLYTAVRNI